MAMAKSADYLDIESKSVKEKPFTISGIPIPVSNLITRQTIERALALKPQPNDVILSSYPKSDSKTVDAIVWKLLYMDLKLPPYCSTTNRFLPCMEMSTFEDMKPAYEYISKHKLPKLHKTYLPFKLMPFYRRAKYIYVMRTPWEACVSYYALLRLIDCVPDSFDAFFKDFLYGRAHYGSYFKHIMSWRNRIHESNILILCREHVEHNPRSAIYTIAAFLGDRYLTMLLNNSEAEASILSATNWDKKKSSKNSCKMSCLSHPNMNCIKTSLDDVKMLDYIKPSCSESQLKEITELVSVRFKDTSIEFLWLSLLKKQTPNLFI